jgi:hypothetical protein
LDDLLLAAGFNILELPPKASQVVTLSSPSKTEEKEYCGMERLHPVTSFHQDLHRTCLFIPLKCFIWVTPPRGDASAMVSPYSLSIFDH